MSIYSTGDEIKIIENLNKRTGPVALDSTNPPKEIPETKEEKLFFDNGSTQPLQLMKTTERLVEEGTKSEYF